MPQGSVLGLLLFLIFINHINSDISVNIRLYIDKSVLYEKITCVEDQVKFKKDFAKVTKCCEIWQTKIMKLCASSNL